MEAREKRLGSESVSRLPALTLSSIQKLIQQRKLAPFNVAFEARRDNTDECPICFLWYSGGLNTSSCCKKPICTECFVRIRRPNKYQPACCPYCNHLRYGVVFSGPKTVEQREKEEAEEQKVIEARIHQEADARATSVMTMPASEHPFESSPPSPGWMRPSERRRRRSADAIDTARAWGAIPTNDDTESQMLMEAIRQSIEDVDRARTSSDGSMVVPAAPDRRPESEDDDELDLALAISLSLQPNRSADGASSAKQDDEASPDPKKDDEPEPSKDDDVPTVFPAEDRPSQAPHGEDSGSSGLLMSDGDDKVPRLYRDDDD